MFADMATVAARCVGNNCFSRERDCKFRRFLNEGDNIEDEEDEDEDDIVSTPFFPEPIEVKSPDGSPFFPSPSLSFARWKALATSENEDVDDEDEDGEEEDNKSEISLLVMRLFSCSC